MAYDEGLAERIRTATEGEAGLTEKRMFGGLCFLVDGKMCCGIVKDELMVRVGPDRHAEALAQPHARPMDFTGRSMKGFVFVAPSGIESDQRLEWWVGLGVAHAREVLKAARAKDQAAKPLRRKPPSSKSVGRQRAGSCKRAPRPRPR